MYSFQELEEKFNKLYSRSPEVKVFSPMRLCPLGAHSDHQHGLVTGFALDHGIKLVCAPREDGKLNVSSLDFDQSFSFDLSDLPAKPQGNWADYLPGAAFALMKKYPLKVGFDALVAGDLPTGGLGSSAAVGVAYLLAFELLNDIGGISGRDNIELDRLIENEYLAIKNGILDQSITILGRANSLVYLDCRSEGYQTIETAAEQPLQLVVYSGCRQALRDTAFNDRVDDCHNAARWMLEKEGLAVPELPRLRDLSRAVFDRYENELPAALQKRARHFYTEYERVERGAEAWRAGDFEQLGDLITESGESSIHNFEVGRKELIELYQLMNKSDSVYGARFSGGGFRGSCIGLAKTAADPEQLRAEILIPYLEKFPEYKDSADLFLIGTSDGASVV